MVAKTTPFGTFCAVTYGDLRSERGIDDIALSLVGSSSKTRYPRLNRALYPALSSPLYDTVDALFRLEVTVNPSVMLEDGRYVFLVSKDGKETFFRISANAELAAVLDYARSARTVGDVVTYIAHEKVFEATEESALEYCRRLLEIGIVQVVDIVDNQDTNWDKVLRGFAEPIDNLAARRLANTLITLRDHMSAFDSPGENQVTAYRGMLDAVSAHFEDVGAQQVHSRFTPVYEDARANCHAVLEVPLEKPSAFSSLETFVRLTSRLAPSRTRMANMRHFFELRFGSDSAVPLMTFYETFFKEHRKEHISRSQLLAGGSDAVSVENPFDLEFPRLRTQALRGMTALVVEKFRSDPHAEEIVLSADEISECLGSLPANGAGPHSISVFCQIVPGTGDEPARLVVPDGATLVGFGKYFSRFLHMIPPDVTRELLNANGRAGNAGCITEILGEIDFNANFHPPLTKASIITPTKLARHSTLDDIRAHDLVVAVDPHNAQLLGLFTRQNNTRVWPVDLGFLNPKMRTALYQLLSDFSPVGGFAMSFRPFGHTNGKALGLSESTGVICMPRVSFERLVVLARRCWRVSVSQVPKGDRLTLSYFEAIQDWRNRAGIPSRIFLRYHKPIAASAHSPAASEGRVANDGTKVRPPRGTSQPRGSRFGYKPQFIDFESPLLVELFRSFVLGVEGGELVLEECLPDLSHGTALDGDRWVTESLLQLDLSPNEK
jgi:hypothetical protein